MSKGYGLIIPGSKKGASSTQPKQNFSRLSIFASDSDSDDTTPFPSVKKTPTIGPGVNEKRQAKKLQEKALEEDPTIFQYDEHYDEIENKRDQERTEKRKEQREPKYIKRLLETAERRKLENERRLERMIQKERELEGEQFKDKESFVTSAYRKKLEEIRKAEEREKREEYLEAIGDVTRQQNLDGFYRHLYEQKLGPKEKDIEEDNTLSNEISNSENKSSIIEKEVPKDKAKSAKSRAYRKRQSSDDEKDSHENISLKKTHLNSNLDADSDFSIDSSSSGEEDENLKVFKTPVLPEKNSENKVEIKKETSEDNLEVKDVVVKTEPLNEKSPQLDKTENEKKPVQKINKQDIWKKRTVGEVFDAALKRYYERKAARNA